MSTMSRLSHKSRRKMRKLNCGRSRGVLHSRRKDKKNVGKEQLRLATHSSPPLHSAPKEDSLLTFSELPDECKLRVFSCLTDVEKCVAAQVCSDWARVMRTPRLWQVADFTYGLSRRELPKDKFEAITCVKERAKNYVYHLVSRGALIRSLIFTLDIVEGEEIWLKFLIYCLKMTNSHELKVVNANWTNSPEFMPFRAEERHWKSDRVKSFLSFLIALSETSPAVEELCTPCDWSMPSVHILCKFKQLHTLELDKYWVFALFRQENLNRLLDNLPRLKRFKLTVCVPLLGTLSFPEYTVCSKSLEVLDISNCTCFFLRSVKLPSLIAFSTARNRWNGPMLSRDALRVSCLHNILKVGAPNLRHYNQSPVGVDWRSKVTPDFEEALKSSCYCSRHKRGYLLY